LVQHSNFLEVDSGRVLEFSLFIRTSGVGFCFRGGSPQQWYPEG